MELTVLVDNNTLIDRYLLGEPGISYLIEDHETRILFDLGYSDAFMINARKLGLDLLNLDYIALSHGHLDHTWGLDPLVRALTEARIEGLTCKRPTVIAHPDVFATKTVMELPEIGTMISMDKLARHMDMQLSKAPVWITSHLVFLGEIPRIFPFEDARLGATLRNGVLAPDDLLDDTSLAYVSSQGLVIITGCAHAGICNTIEYAKKVCNTKQIHDVIGGFHLQSPATTRMEQTTGYLAAQGICALHPCHCTDLGSKIALSRVLPVYEVGSGLHLFFPESCS
ncbi:MAG: MBL fold metallo-hydrolase [Desulfoplanes sp.]|jgi:7,8-dihydropterin-6-yl-methyl-4-(beta-D-ribofuranosyl)aminobenzene 5'-phosphate synthase|nr:MBL fold metallo-hydrolase [Desulfoplanes sp.]MDD4649982.1 MBL fold metallo-hydrolase [Desulfoplanes sp.]